MGVGSPRLSALIITVYWLLRERRTDQLLMNPIEIDRILSERIRFRAEWPNGKVSPAEIRHGPGPILKGFTLEVVSR
jgi:hypothetical protein